MIIDCPFSECSARIELIVEQAEAGDDESIVQRVPQHATGGAEWFGTCPASLVLIPLQPHAIENFAAQGRMLRHVRDQRDAAADTEKRRPGGEPEHSLTPHPFENQWFRPRPGSSPKHNPPLQGHEPLQPVPTGGSSNVATVAEIRSAIDRANALIAEVQDAANSIVGDKLSEAEQIIRRVQQTSVDPIGLPQIASALEANGTVITSCHLAIEQTNTYAGTL